MKLKYKLWYYGLTLALLLSLTQANAQALKSYQLFNKNGDPVEFQYVVSNALDNDIVLFGELHNNPISHWLQFELTITLHSMVPDRIILGAEMFETDNQLIIDEYFAGWITERNFRAEARLWNNYETDIRPVLEFARANQIRYIASNIPRRYASLVSREGFEGLEKLSTEALSYIAPLPVAYDSELAGYKAMLEMAGMPAHSANENFPKAQAIKDATMAHFILKNFDPGSLFIHFHGTYHSNNFEGIVWYLLRENKDLRLITIATTEQSQLQTLDQESIGLADFILVTPETMTKTF